MTGIMALTAIWARSDAAKQAKSAGESEAEATRIARDIAEVAQRKEQRETERKDFKWNCHWFSRGDIILRCDGDSVPHDIVVRAEIGPHSEEVRRDILVKPPRDKMVSASSDTDFDTAFGVITIPLDHLWEHWGLMFIMSRQLQDYPPFVQNPNHDGGTIAMAFDAEISILWRTEAGHQMSTSLSMKAFDPDSPPELGAWRGSDAPEQASARPSASENP